MRCKSIANISLSPSFNILRIAVQYHVITGVLQAGQVIHHPPPTVPYNPLMVARCKQAANDSLLDKTSLRRIHPRFRRFVTRDSARV